MQKYFTPEGLEKLKEELVELQLKRKELAEKIAEAKELGDLSENAEYHAAKDAQGMNESRIIEIEATLKQAVVVEKKGATDTVQVGSKIVIENSDGKKEFEIVGSNEADPANGKISNESPFGKAFMNKQVGDHVVVEMPKGSMDFVVKKIA